MSKAMLFIVLDIIVSRNQNIQLSYWVGPYKFCTDTYMLREELLNGFWGKGLESHPLIFVPLYLRECDEFLFINLTVSDCIYYNFSCWRNERIMQTKWRGFLFKVWNGKRTANSVVDRTCENCERYSGEYELMLWD